MGRLVAIPSVIYRNVSDPEHDLPEIIRILQHAVSLRGLAEGKDGVDGRGDAAVGQHRHLAPVEALDDGRLLGDRARPERKAAKPLERSRPRPATDCSALRLRSGRTTTRLCFVTSALKERRPSPELSLTCQR